ncbi:MULTISPECIES: YcxB family protein [unclassified Novosphingobium]|uniref:YcxB family protein n=1 Tax=unclassified Novosphingobium TaxID=2644732 RepID=UPI001304F9AE|nr:MULTISPECIES: YcxB family protein [unclassified Novosphingobium]MBB3478438.1 hypothetical protein [Novosphingobium sp. BK369]NOX05685.1 hypothetical protein [Novosphingobium sp. SG754]
MTITMSYQDYLEANRLRSRSRWTLAGILRFVLLITVAYTALFVVIEFPHSWIKLAADAITAFVVALCAYAGIRIFLLWHVPRLTKKLYAQQPSARAPYQFSFDNEGIKAIGPFESSNLPWSHLNGWLENDRLFLLSKTTLTFFCLPKDQIGEANLSALKQCLSDAGIKRGI